MAQKVSKKKKPDRYHYLLKEREKIEDCAIDKYVLLIISNLRRKKIFYTLDYPISTGKEANIYRATTHDGDFVVVKIFRLDTTHFFNKTKYLEGDPRFKRIRRDLKNLAFLFCNKEFSNLKLCERMKLNSPKAIICEKNVLVMEFLGEKGLPYPPLTMLDTIPDYLEQILAQIKKMYKNNLVHADLSEYNILAAGKKPILIDFAQAVIKGHPRFDEFLERDVKNILKFFKSKKSAEKVLEWIKS